MDPSAAASAPPVKPEKEQRERRQLEHGELELVVRPRVDHAPGIQRFMLHLEPDRGPARRVVIGKKRLPRVGARDRLWAYVERVAENMHELWTDLGPSTRMTKSKGLRRQPGAYVVATAAYRIMAHGAHTHLDYVLHEDVANDASLLEATGIEASGSAIVAVFNPIATWSRQATRRYGSDPDDPTPFSEPSIFSDELQEKFGDYRFAALEPSMLDVEGVELVLIDGTAA